MPIIGTENTTSTVPGTPCTEQDLAQPVITEVHDVPVPQKRRAVSIMQRQRRRLRLNMFTATGQPVDLTTCGFTADLSESSLSSESDSSSSGESVSSTDHTIGLYAREHIGLDGLILAKAATVLNAGEGLVQVVLEPEDTAVAGIYVAELRLINGDDQTVYTDVFYLVIEPSLGSTCTGMPSIAEIRLHLRDNAPEDNLLLDHVDFDLAEISLAVARPIQLWNELLPPVAPYTTSDFPYRYHWLQAIAGNLFLIAAEHYRRNHLPYNAGGVAIDDKNKFMQYEQAGQLRLAEFKQWAQSRKIAINISNGFSSFGSDYGYR